MVPIFDLLGVLIIPRLAVAVTATKSLRLRSNPKPQRIFNFFEIYAKDVQTLEIALEMWLWSLRYPVKSRCWSVKFPWNMNFSSKLSNFKPGYLFQYLVSFKKKFFYKDYLSISLWKKFFLFMKINIRARGPFRTTLISKGVEKARLWTKVFHFFLFQ